MAEDLLEALSLLSLEIREDREVTSWGFEAAEGGEVSVASSALGRRVFPGLRELLAEGEWAAPLRFYAQLHEAPWVSSAASGGAESDETLRRIGRKKFRVGEKVAAEGFRFSPVGGWRISSPVSRVEFWLADVGGLRLLLRYEATSSVRPFETRLSVRRVAPWG